MYKSFVLFTALIGGTYTFAQDSTKPSQLDPVVVTATKYPIKLSETGKIVTVISREQVARSQGKSLAQLLTEQSGTIVNGANSNPGKDKSVFLRGASNEYTLILLDGVPVNDPSGPGGAFDLRLFPIEQIDHIEILKGSQSTLYGSDAMAGVINIITKKGGDKKLSLNGGLNYGNYKTVNANAGIRGSINKIDYNLVYTNSSSDGISEALDTTGKGSFDKDGFNRNSFQANLSFMAGGKVKIAPYYRYSYYRGGFDADAFTDGTNEFDALLNNAGVIATVTLPKGTLTANYGYTYAKRLYASDFGTTPFRGGFNSGEIYLTQQLTKGVKFLAGINYQDYRLTDTTLEIKNPNTNIISPYLSFFWQPVTKLNIEGGTRYNYHSQFKSNLTYSFNASYQVLRSLKAFANVSTGFKAPGVSDLFGPVMYGSNPDLKPEKSFNIEGGTQITALDNTLQFTGSVYYREISDLISYVGMRLINVDEQKDHGVELEAAYRPNERWNFRASYNYVDGKLFQNRNQKDTSFFNLIRRPKNSITANAGFQATPNLYISVSLQSLCKRTDLFFAPPTYASMQVDLSAYTLLNAYIEYKLFKNKFLLFVDARNLTDAEFTEVYGYSTMGINGTAGFRFNL
ncbi:MAG: TonB-dependent receptor [Rhizobacter sp.]|nr:TonB-dependent receptor [Ferruginibacter sp.]